MDTRELGIAIIGGGFMGRAHTLAYGIAAEAQEIGVKVRRQVLVEATPELAESAARRLGWAEGSASWQEVVRRPDIQIVDICTPPQFHKAIALAAIAAGKNVFCEKPIANTLEDAREMQAAASAAKVVTQVGFNYRHTPAISFMKQLLDAGKLGDPMAFRGTYLAEAFFADPKRWRAARETGGSGVVGDIGSHILDIAEYLVGDIVRVSALVRAKRPGTYDGWASEGERHKDNLLDDGAMWLAEFENGAIGSFTANSYASGHKNHLSFGMDATRGGVEFDWNRREEFRVSYVDEAPDHLGFRTIHMNNRHPDGWWHLAGLGTGYIEITAIQMQHFLRAVAAGTPTRPDFADGARIQMIVDAVKESASTNEWTKVPTREMALQI
jgi:predicted dehydrogenase